MLESLFVVRGPIGVGKSSVSEAIKLKLPNEASIVETDAIKRMLDPNQSSTWRRNIAHDAAVYLTERLVQLPRITIVEAHTKYQRTELPRYRQIAEDQGIPLINVLLLASLEICKERAASRDVPGIHYDIDGDMVYDYYCNLDPMPGDLVFDTTMLSPVQIADEIVACQ